MLTTITLVETNISKDKKHNSFSSSKRKMKKKKQAF